MSPVDIFFGFVYTLFISMNITRNSLPSSRSAKTGSLPGLKRRR